MKGQRQTNSVSQASGTPERYHNNYGNHYRNNNKPYQQFDNSRNNLGRTVSKLTGLIILYAQYAKNVTTLWNTAVLTVSINILDETFSSLQLFNLVLACLFNTCMIMDFLWKF